MPTVTAESLDAELQLSADPVRAERERGYLKSELTHYGTTVPPIHALAKRHGRSLDRAALLAVATRLWDEPVQAPVFERRFLAADLLANRTDLLVVEDIGLIERLLRQSGTWALVDTIAPSVVGPLDEREAPRLTSTLDRWAHDEDFWIRRASLLTHLVPLRQGRGDWQRFTRYAESMLDDRQFFVAKAIGWVVRDTGRRRPDLVLPWVERHILRMRPVTVREVLKPFPTETQQRLRRLRDA